jgi:N-acetylmuramoyl-L-alanine amidase
MKILSSTAALLLAVTAGEAATAKADHRTLYEHAQTARAALDKSAALQKKTAEWTKVIDAYRSVVHHYPQSPYCDNSLLAIGDLYGAMSTRFKVPRYRQQAIDAYRDLVGEYPSSSLGEEALYKVFLLAQGAHEENLIAEATEAYLEAFPAGKNARAVKAVIKNKAAPSPPPPELAKVFGSSLRFWSGPTSTRVVVELERQVTIAQQDRLTGPDRMFVDLAGTRLHPNLTKQVFPVGDGLLETVNIAQNRPGVVRVVLYFKAARDHKVFFLPAQGDTPPRLVIDVNNTPPPPKAGETTMASTDPFPTTGPIEPAPPSPTPVAVPLPTVVAAAAATATPTPVPRAEMKTADLGATAPTTAPPRDIPLTVYRQLGLNAHTIVIDAGHGGHDTGCIGRDGLQEKELVLSVALRLAKLIKSEIKGAEVILTRDKDEFIPLVDRTAIANTKGADLFLSIHANSARDRAASGLETYYLNFTEDSHSQEVAARENEMSQARLNDVGGLVQAILKDSKVPESRVFAGYVQDAMVSGLQPHNQLAVDRKVRKAPFLVLVGSNMPAVLAEIAFVSNPTEEELLKTSAYRDKIAQGLLRGVKQYLESLNHAPMEQLTAANRKATVNSKIRALPPLETKRRPSRH